ncbi:MAG: hypothetical protein FJ023_07680 [Chloroflexi bacterium]|nr:hypothetical protein [Chloroflexota bacterium]
MKLKPSLWNQIIPYCVATIAIAYLIYVLAVQGNPIQYIHFWIFVLVVALVLAPLAGKLKIWNLIDFNSKFESLREENRRELDQIRNQITSVVQTSIVPMQHQWTVLGIDDNIAKKLAESITERFKSLTLPTVKGIKIDDPTHLQFLRKAYRYRSSAYEILSTACAFKTAIREHRILRPQELGSGTNDDRINYMLKFILDGGVELFVPPPKMAKTIKQLQDIQKLLELSKKLDRKETDLPSEKDINKIFNNVHDSLAWISAGIVIIGSQAIIVNQNINMLVKKWKDSSDSLIDNLENKS